MSASHGKSTRATNGHHPPQPSLAERAGELKDEAGTVVDAIADGVSEQVQKNPYGMVAAALGIGYVLGGGLFTRTTGRLFELGAKLVMIPAVRDPLLDMAEQAIDGLLSDDETEQSNKT